MLCKTEPWRVPCCTADGKKCYGGKLWGGSNRIRNTDGMTECPYPHKAVASAHKPRSVAAESRPAEIEPAMLPGLPVGVKYE